MTSKKAKASENNQLDTFFVTATSSNAETACSELFSNNLDCQHYHPRFPPCQAQAPASVERLENVIIQTERGGEEKCEFLISLQQRGAKIVCAFLFHCEISHNLQSHQHFRLSSQPPLSLKLELCRAYSNKHA